MGHDVIEDGKFRMVCVLAVDWTMFGEQMKLRDIDDMDVLTVMVGGFLVREDSEYLCLAQQIFDDEDYSIRFTVMIPKICIIDRHDMELKTDGMADGPNNGSEKRTGKGKGSGRSKSR